jgi:hypothetical protein
MLTSRNSGTAVVRSRIHARKTWAVVLIASVAAFPAAAQENASENRRLEAPNTGNAGLPPAIEEKVNAYQACINSVMSTLETAVVKRLQIGERCSAAREQMVNGFPEQLRPLIDTNTERRIDSVLTSLEQIERAVIESAEDVNGISEELKALSDTTPNKN